MCEVRFIHHQSPIVNCHTISYNILFAFDLKIEIHSEHGEEKGEKDGKENRNESGNGHNVRLGDNVETSEHGVGSIQPIDCESCASSSSRSAPLVPDQYSSKLGPWQSIIDCTFKVPSVLPLSSATVPLFIFPNASSISWWSSFISNLQC